MQIAYTSAPGRGDIDGLMAEVATRLADADLRTCGTVQINSECDTGGPCDMDVKVLPDGPLIRISQSLGANARGCRLDPAALEEATRLSALRLEQSDVLIVNKFGKHEASGRGFRDVISAAVMAEIPVVVGLNALNRTAFEEFAADVCVELAPDADVITKWAQEHCVVRT